MQHRNLVHTLCLASTTVHPKKSNTKTACSEENDIQALHVVHADIELLFTQKRATYKLCTWSMLTLNYYLLKRERNKTFVRGPC